MKFRNNQSQILKRKQLLKIDLMLNMLFRVIYSIYEYDPLLDSSNMTMDDWIQIAKDIEDAYELFDGFVILHGTDTLAYTASALSFMLENLGMYLQIFFLFLNNTKLKTKNDRLKQTSIQNAMLKPRNVVPRV